MLPVWMDVAEMRIRGLSPKQLFDEVMKKFESGSYQRPSRSGISYMIAPLMRSYPATGRGDWKRLPAFVRRYYLRAEVAQGLRPC